MRRALGSLARLGRAPGRGTPRRGFCASPPVPAQEPAAGSVDLPRQRLVPPLTLSGRVVLYTSALDIQEVVSVARRRCQLGAVFAAGGFGLIVFNAAAAIPPIACALLLSGAAANSYALAVIAQRLVRSTAARHVDCLAVLPTPESAARAAAEARARGAGAASLLCLAATVEERLAATPELALEVRTADATRWLTLADAPEAAGGEELRGLGSGSASQRAPFADICGRLGLLHVNTEDGTCSDHAFLSAVTTTRKVVVEERVESRQDTCSLLATPPGSPVRGPMLAELSLADVERAAPLVGAEVPAEAIDRVGWRARTGGMSVLAAGMLFAVAESAKDPDGVPRWKNLNLPI